MNSLDVLEPAGLHAPRGYSHAVVTSGALLHVAGQVALAPDGALVGPGDFAAQVEQSLSNVEAALSAAGATSASIASLTIYIAGCVPRSEIAPLQHSLDRRFQSRKRPAITLLFVHALMHQDWLIEVQATAIAGRPLSAQEQAMLAMGA